MSLFKHDKEYFKQGFKVFAGIDEAGRGPLAGPVAAAAVVFESAVYEQEDNQLKEINDSKKLSSKKRAFLFDVIKQKSIAYSICLVDNEEIDKINILQATYKAMNLAWQDVFKQLNRKGIALDMVLVDGNKTVPAITTKQLAVVGGDAKSFSIAAASILAKVTRDNVMDNYAKQFPSYSFAKHKGYGTKLHTEEIVKYGLCTIHRKTFTKNIKIEGK